MDNRLNKDEIINLIKAGVICKSTKLWIDSSAGKLYPTLNRAIEQFFREAQEVVAVLLIETKEYRAARVLFKKDNHYLIADAENITMIEPGERK